MYTAKGQLDRDALIRQYSPLVRRLAHHMMAKLPPSVQVDDLIQVGMIGLSDALSRFDAGQGVQFETFATQRILRQIQWEAESIVKPESNLAGQGLVGSKLTGFLGQKVQATFQQGPKAHFFKPERLRN